jgi:hypothetical protein
MGRGGRGGVSIDIGNDGRSIRHRTSNINPISAGVYCIYFKIPPPRGGKISAEVIWGKNMKRGREKVRKARQKERNGKNGNRRKKERK